MANFAKLNDSNEVIDVIVVNDSAFTDEASGITFLQGLYGSDTKWKQTSFNTWGNKHYTGIPFDMAVRNMERAETLSDDQTKAFRGNFAQIGGTYDPSNDIFIPPRPIDSIGTSCASWTFNTTTALWEPPIDFPTILDDGQDPVVFIWSFNWYEADYQADNTKGWKAIKNNGDGSDHTDTNEYYWDGSAWTPL